MKLTALGRLIAACTLAALACSPAMAQTITTGTMTPIASSPLHPAAHRSGHKPHQHVSHAKTHHKGKAPFLPANEQFSSLSAARAQCPADEVEWATMDDSALYHNSRSRWFGRTKHGVYACKAALDAAGFRLGK